MTLLRNISNNQILTLISFGLLNFFAVSLSLFRVVIGNSQEYLYLNWNLFLALIPLIFSYLLLNDSNKSKFSFYNVLLIFLWLLFFPNSGYIITDLLHLADGVYQPIIPAWYDGTMLFFYSLSGLLAALYSLYIVHISLIKKVSYLQSWLIVSFFIFLNGLGIYLGRFLRWNSWDILNNPWQLIIDIFSIFTHPLDNLVAWSTIVIFFCGFQILYLLTYSILQSKKNLTIETKQANLE